MRRTLQIVGSFAALGLLVTVFDLVAGQLQVHHIAHWHVQNWDWLAWVEHTPATIALTRNSPNWVVIVLSMVENAFWYGAVGLVIALIVQGLRWSRQGRQGAHLSG